MITIPTVAQERDLILADIEAATGQTAPLLSRAVWRVLATALAGALVLLYRLTAWAYRQIFTATSDDEALIRRGNEYGLTRTPATKWIGTATASGTTGTVIPAGTTFALDGNVYETTEEETIAAGVATLDMQSLETGDDVDLEVADVLTITSPIAGVDSTVTVASVTQAAEDAEDIEDFRSRVAQRQQEVPQGGAIPDWRKWTIEVSGISECIVERPTPGFVNIYPLTDDADPADRIPDSAKLDEVEAYVTDQSRSPIRAAAVTVSAPTELNFDVDIGDLSPNDAATKAAIEAAIETYMYARRPKQYSDQIDDKSIVSAAAITSIAIAAGMEIGTVDLKNAGGSSITDYTLEYDELAVLRTLTWV